MDIVYFDARDVTVGFDAKIPAVVVEHHGYQTSQEFHRAIKTAIRCYQEQSVNYPQMGWLADTRMQGPLSSEDLNWCYEIISEQCPTLRKIALVMPADMFGNLSIEEFNNIGNAKVATNPESKLVFTTYIFENKAHASAWLQEPE